jgi:hypothetical protein
LLRTKVRELGLASECGEERNERPRGKEREVSTIEACAGELKDVSAKSGKQEAAEEGTGADMVAHPLGFFFFLLIFLFSSKLVLF